MDIREGIKSQFSDIGFEIPDSILDKCVELCVLHNIDEETFLETWMAYSVTNLAGEPPTIETLMQMERKEFAKQDKPSSTNTSSSRQCNTPLRIYNKTPTSNKTPSAERWNQLDTTPTGTKNGRVGGFLPTTGSRSAFSPGTFSPVSTTPSGKYSSRINAGEAVADYVERTPGDWKGKERGNVTVAPYRDHALSSRCKIMMEPLSEKAAVLNDVIERISSHLLEMNGLPEPTNNHKVALAEVVCVGRICCDSNDHLNPSSVLLEGSCYLCLGKSVSLDLSKLTHYSLFPGQVVAVSGINPTGQRFIVNKLYSSAPLPSPVFLPRFSSTMQLVVAAGPFTLADSLAYEPLEDLLNYVKSHKPHVLILIGPLVDLRQPQLTVGSIAESYDALYEKIVNGVLEQLKGSWTQLVIVSSASDGTCLPVFPTPPPVISSHESKASALHLVSDPSILSINGLVIGLTATDSLMHLGKEEITLPAGGSDRLGRLASHLLQQQNFYPLSPSNEEVVIDSELWDCHSSLPVTPHVLVVPSQFRYFIKHLHGCLVLNPERLTKGAAGGTFARLEVDPPTDDVWSPTSHISAQIVKI